MTRLLLGCSLLVAACSSDPVTTDSTDPDDDTVTDTTVDTTDTVDTVDTVDTDPEPLTCASPELEAALQQMASWPNLASCAHVWFGAISESRNHALTFNLNTALRDFEIGDQIVHDFARPAGQLASLGIQVGTEMSRICTTSQDTGGAPTVARSWLAEAGTVTLDVSSVDKSEGGDGPHPFKVTMTMEGIVLKAIDSTGDRCPMPTVSWSEVTLGQMPE